MLRSLYVLAILSIALACSRSTTIYAPEPIETEQGPAMKLSFVASPSANGTRCMYDRPGILYWSNIGITATVLEKGQWVYHTYSWEYIGVRPDAGEVSYGINNGRLIFPGDLRAIWNPQDR
ncbi:MAG: hypothetical protein OXI35_06465 [Gemmatimonadota bacterium]|nr:hypothetical protein [Gemmatimonadota bacterium]